MFDYLAGRVISCSSGNLVLDIGGVGFSIRVPLSTEIKLKQDTQAKVVISMVVREDSMKLYGFCTIGERELFEKLHAISGIGPVLALAILSGGTFEALRNAIMLEDLTYFKKIKGVGPKTAKRIILELKGSMPDLHGDEQSPQIATNLQQDAVAALVGLGIQHAHAVEIVEKSLKKLGVQTSLDELIRESLKEL